MAENVKQFIESSATFAEKALAVADFAPLAQTAKTRAQLASAFHVTAKQATTQAQVIVAARPADENFYSDVMGAEAMHAQV